MISSAEFSRMVLEALFYFLLFWLPELKALSALLKCVGIKNELNATCQNKAQLGLLFSLDIVIVQSEYYNKFYHLVVM